MLESIGLIFKHSSHNYVDVVFFMEERVGRGSFTSEGRFSESVGTNLFLVPMLFLIVAAVHAQDPQSTPTPPAEPSPSRWQWSFTFRNRTGLKLNEPHQFQMSRNLFEAKGRYKIGVDWKFTLEAREHYDPVQRLGYPSSVWVDLRQVVLDGKVKKVDLKLGLQQVVWGQADGLRVLDVINPLDYREFILEDFLDSRRPLWMARAEVPIKKGSMQFLWVPYFAPGRLPGPDNEFGLGSSFGLGLINSATTQAGFPQFPLRVEETEGPAYRLKSSQGGARYSRSIRSWDLTANYFFGWEDVPTTYISGEEFTSGFPLPRIVMKPRHDRREVFGGTAATNFGSVVLRLEAGWNRNKSVAVTDYPLQSGFEKFGQSSSVVGVDWSARTWLWISSQYFLQFTSAPEHRLLFPRYNHLASFYFRTNFFRDTLRPELFVLAGLNQREYMIRPRLTKSINDHWSVS